MRWPARAARSGIHVVAGTIIPYNTATPDQNARMRVVNAWIEQRASAEPRIEFVDTRAAVAAPGAPDKLVDSPDQLHPSATAYKLMAEAMRPVLERVAATLPKGR